MTLTNYWWLLIWPVLAGGVLTVAAPRGPVQLPGRSEYRWSIGAALILVCPLVIWAAFRGNIGDTGAYQAMFRNIPTLGSGLIEYLSKNSKDRGFYVLASLLKTVFGSDCTLFFFIIAAFQIFCITYFFRRYSTDFLLCIFMFVLSTDYLSWMFNGIRQFIAVCIILLTFGLVLRKKYIPAILIILLASTIHGSALMMIPLIFVIQGRAWNQKTILMIVAVAVTILFIDRFTDFLDSVLIDTQYSDIVTNDIWKNDDGTNILRALFYSIPAILSIAGKKHIDEADSPVINLCVNCSICTAALYFLSVFSSGIYVGRLPIYTTFQGYAVVPWLINHIFTKRSAAVVTTVLMAAYLAFFYYQMHFTWGAL